MQRKTPVGNNFYRKKGLDKVITLHVTKELHDALVKLAKKEERSLQVTVRRLVERGVKES
ncbi:MAG: hypothetical protein JNK54_10545 [Elusimicrobia bacterium]|nr:hypothetical protein [Elusimicrobiota bacterium]